MKREGTLEDISDGKFYHSNDLVKAGCNECNGCSACCHGMGNSLVLDPYDICQLTNNLHISFTELLNGKLELNIFEGVILPNMAMHEKNEACGFLNSEGRCSIHSFRPGICRLFPLGRYYENGTFHYILQTNECKKQNRTKVKIKHFLNIPNLKEYEAYINDWHYFIKEIEQLILPMMAAGQNEQAKAISMNLLNSFFIMPYDLTHFFEQYYDRKKQFSAFLSQFQG